MNNRDKVAQGQLNITGQLGGGRGGLTSGSGRAPELLGLLLQLVEERSETEPAGGGDIV